MNITSATEEVGSLLDELVSKLGDSEHLVTIAQYVVDGKIRRVQLQAAFKFVAANKTFDVAAFEKECGVGVIVSAEAVAASVATLCTAQEAALNEKKWGFQSQLFTLAKSDAVLKWADGFVILIHFVNIISKLLKDAIEAELVKRLGDRKAATKAPAQVANAGVAKINEAELDANVRYFTGVPNR